MKKRKDNQASSSGDELDYTDMFGSVMPPSSPADDLPLFSPQPSNRSSYDAWLLPGETPDTLTVSTYKHDKPKRSKRRVIGAGVAVLTLAGAAFAAKGLIGGEESSQVGDVSTHSVETLYTPTSLNSPVVVSTVAPKPENTISIAANTLPTVAETLPVPTEVQGTHNPAFEKTGDPVKDAVIAWYEKAGTDIHVNTVDTPFVVAPGIDLAPLTGESNVTSISQEVLHKAQAEFQFAFVQPSGLKVNVYVSSLNGKPNIAISASSIAIAMSNVIRFIGQDNTGYLNDTEVRKITSGNLSDNVFNLVILGQKGPGGVCAEDLESTNTAGRLGLQCGVEGFLASGTVHIGDPVEATAIVQIEDIGYGGEKTPSVIDAIKPDQEAAVDKAIRHEFGHFLAITSGSRLRHEEDANKLALAQAIRPDGSVDQALQTVLAQKYVDQIGSDEHTELVNSVGDRALNDDQLRRVPIPINSGTKTILAPILPFLTPPVTLL
jgi:hypothetical protein